MKIQIQKFIAYCKRNWLVTAFVVVFAIIGTALLINSFALEPNTPYEVISKLNNLHDLEKAPTTAVNADSAIYTQTDTHPFSLLFPSDWQIYHLNSNNSDTVKDKDIVYVRLLSPDAKIGGESHTELELTNGAMVEMSAFTNNQYKDVNEYVSQLGDVALNVKSITINGKAAKQYQLVSEEEGANQAVPLKTVTTFFSEGVQYSFSYTAADKETYDTHLNDYNQIINKLALK